MKTTFGAALIASILLATPSYAATLVQYDFTGAPGNQGSTSASNVATGLIGQSFIRGSGLGTTAGAGSINANGFNSEATDFFSFGLNFTTGFTGSVNQILLGSRSSATGPGFVNLLASIDNGAFTAVGTFAQPTTDLYQSFSFSPLFATSSIVFHLAAANQTSASGGTVAPPGTFRIENYVVGSTNTPVSINGTVMPFAAAVPEPATWGMMILGMGAIGFAMRRRNINTRVRFG